MPDSYRIRAPIAHAWSWELPQWGHIRFPALSPPLTVHLTLPQLRSCGMLEEFGFLIFRHFFWHIAAKSWRRAGVPAKTTAYSQVTGNIITCARRDSNSVSCDRQLAASGNALDHSALRTGPGMLGERDLLLEKLLPTSWATGRTCLATHHIIFPQEFSHAGLGWGAATMCLPHISWNMWTMSLYLVLGQHLFSKF